MNKKLKLGFLAVLCGFVIVGCDSKTPEELIAAAEHHVASNDNEAAIIELKNAISQYPEEANARLMIALIYNKEGDLVSAEKELNKALELGSQPDEVYPSLVEVLFYSDQFDAAIDLSTESITRAESISKIKLTQYLSTIRSSSSENSMTIDEISSLLSKPDLLVAKGYMAYEKQDFDLSRKLLQEIQNNNYSPAEAQYLSAMISYQEKDFAEAASSFTTLKELKPGLNSVDFMLVDTLIKSNQFKKAEEKTNALLNLNEQQPMTNFYMALIKYENKDYNKSFDFATSAIQNGLDIANVRLIAGISAYKIGKMENAYRNLLNLNEREEFHNDDVKRLLAQLQLNLGYTEEANETLEEILAVSSQDADLFAQIGVKLARSGDLDKGQKLLKKANTIDQSNTSNKILEALLYAGINEELVIEGLENVLDNNSAIKEGWMQLALAHIRNKNIDAALEIARKWAQTNLTDGKLLEGLVYLKANRIDASIAVLKEVLVIEPEMLGAHLYLLLAYEKSLDFEKLYTQAESVLMLYPNNIQALTALVKSGKYLKRNKEVVMFLTNLYEKNESKVVLNIALALNAKVNGQQQKVIDLLAPLDQELSSLGLMLLADAYRQLQKYDLALNMYRQWRVYTPTSVTPYLRAIGLNEAKGDFQQAISLLEEALAKFPNDPSLKTLKAGNLIKTGQIQEAKVILAQVRETKKDGKRATLDLYEGQIALIEKDYDMAEELLTKYYNEYPSFEAAVLVAKAMQMNGKVSSSKVLLEHEISKTPETSMGRRHALTAFYTYNGYYQEAIEQYIVMLEQEADSAVILNNTAYAYLQLEQYKKAHYFALKAFNIEPNSAEILDTLGWVEFKLSNNAEAYKHLDKALELSPNSNDILLHLSEVQISLGMKSKAKDLLGRLGAPNEKQQERKEYLLKMSR
jgi:putative PEP-CTERM system TPR-repeat lipoprotein